MKKLNKTEAAILAKMAGRNSFCAESQVSRREFKACCSLLKAGLVKLERFEGVNFISNNRTAQGDFRQVRGAMVRILPL